MFKSKGNITKLLDEGRTWVSNLEKEVKLTETEVKEKDKELVKLEAEKVALVASVDEGKAVAANFKKMLTVSK